MDAARQFVHTKDERTSLAMMVTKLFDHWALSTSEQSSLLGIAGLPVREV